jgi:PIN domain nuclease of toxin-antitoxin system
MDRVIIATTLEYAAELISKDETVARYPNLIGRWSD